MKIPFALPDIGQEEIDEVIELAKELEKAGINIINTGIGWHEARAPTIVTSVPRAAFADITGRVKKELSIPCVASNRINMPDVAEEIISSGCDTWYSSIISHPLDINIVAV